MIEEDAVQFLNVVGAAILTGFIGWEREKRNNPAGFRTHMIVGSAAAMLVILGHMMIDYYEVRDSGSALQYDPLRVIQAIIVGISFIGAGTILKVEQKSRIRFLTTAATILIAASIGIAVALQRYLLAVLVTALVLVINYSVRKWEDKENKRVQ